MTRRKVMIRILTVRESINRSLFDQIEPELFDEDLVPPPTDGEESHEPERSELVMEGRLVTTTHRVELVYEESELTGMEGSVTSIGFDRAAPHVISMMRTGLVSTGMIFEAGKRHMCIYHTPFSDFEICVRAFTVNNQLLTDGKLELDYLVELHGAQTERCRMTLTVRNDTSDNVLDPS